MAAGEELSRSVGAVLGGAGSARLDRGAGVGLPAAAGPGGDGDRRAQRQPAHRGQGAGVAGERAQRRPAAQGRGDLITQAVRLPPPSDGLASRPPQQYIEHLPQEVRP